MHKSITSIFALLLTLLSCNPNIYLTTEPGDTVFLGVNVLPMNRDTILKKQTLIIRDGKIWKMGPTAQLEVSGAAQRIDAKGKYLMPGISEMHAHIPTPREGNDENVKETLILYLSNGITTIRGMLGQPYHLELKKQVAEESILSPRVYTSSPSMNGNSVTTIEEAEEKVTQYSEAGYDFLKIHPGIKLDVFIALKETAKKQNITFSGHVPTSITIVGAYEFGYASIDHLDGFIEGLTPKTKDYDPDGGGLFGYEYTDKILLENMPGLVKMIKEKNIWIVPTQSLLVRWLSPKSGAEMANEPEMKYVSGGTRISWRQNKDRITGEDYDAEKAKRFIEIRNSILHEMESQGVDLLLGSDAPQIFNVPGFSIQHEMQAMADAGLSNFTILQSGTANPARFFGAEGSYGVIKEGATADLILLSSNPLENIKHMKELEGVMVRGKWLDKKFMETKLDAIEKKYEE